MSKAITIESNVPIPVVNSGGGRRRSPTANALRTLKVDQSFFSDRTINSMNSYVFYVRLETGFKFTSRTVVEKGVKGCRTWRVA